MSGRGGGPGKQCLCGIARLYLNVCIGLRIAGGGNLRRNVRVMGCVVACSRVRVVDAVRATPGAGGTPKRPESKLPGP
jgi:hypothetical protein